MGDLLQGGRERLYQWRRKLATSGICMLAMIAAYYVVFSAHNGLLVYQEKRRESQELDRQIKSLQQQNSAMEQEVKALKSDPKTIEKEARERLRYARPGEVVYTLPTAPATPSQTKSNP